MIRFIENESGSILVLTTFLVMVITLLMISYWKVIQTKVERLSIQEKLLQAEQAAYGGIADALNELRQGKAWSSDTAPLHPQWESVEGNTLMKSTSAENPLTHFSYPVTISVTVSDATKPTFSIRSESQVGGDYPSQHSIEVVVVRDFSGGFSIIDTKVP